MTTLNRCDIGWLKLDAVVGKELSKTRPVLVLSSTLANKLIGMAMVVPITSTVRGTSLEVALPSQLSTKGVLILVQARFISFRRREWKFIEQAPPPFVDELVGDLTALLSAD